jgi:pimeloyl-ACP methyl ester carboxylesterase
VQHNKKICAAQHILLIFLKMPDKSNQRFGEANSSTPDGRTHIIRWCEWGDPENPDVLLCAHGLSRNGRDFDYLARNICDHYRVICPDFPGRGVSDALENPVYYNNTQYLSDTLAILSAIRFETLDWLGTSMGGLIGMALAACENNPIRKIVLNDVGPFVPREALSVIGEYLADSPEFSSLQQAESYFREVYASFGKLDDEHYRHFVEYGVKPSTSGKGFVLNNDPEIIARFLSNEPVDYQLWDIWDRITVPALIVRGQYSGLLLPQTVEQMKFRHAFAQSVEIPACAHAPSLMTESQIEIVSAWLTD